MALSRDELHRLVAEHDSWYHTLDLAPGLTTPGWFDLRTLADEIGFPADLSGKRCLDVGTFDGHWAFLMEKRGAAEVVAIDLWDENEWDWPTRHVDDTVRQIARRKGAGRGFEIAAAALDSRVTRHELSVYDLDETLGHFDFVYLGSLLLHLRDPVRALERVRSVCTGQVLVVDAIDERLTRLHPATPIATFDGIGRPWWWKPNVAGLVRMLESANFDIIGKPRRVRMPAGAGRRRPSSGARLRGLMRPAARRANNEILKGEPHGALLARPAG